jgi:hypothetical protein
LRTNRETTSEGLHARFVSDHLTAPPATEAQATAPASEWIFGVARVRSDLAFDWPDQYEGSTMRARPAVKSLDVVYRDLRVDLG